MVEINNQRKAFLDMHWRGRRELITNKQYGYDVIVGGELLLITPITLANLSR